MFYILYTFMGGRRAVEGRDCRRLARRREAGGRSPQRSIEVGKYPGSRAWSGAEAEEQHLEEGWVRFSTARAEQGEGGRGGQRGGMAVVSFSQWDVRGNPALWAGMRLCPPAARARMPEGFPIHMLDAALFTARTAQGDGKLWQTALSRALGSL